MNRKKLLLILTVVIIVGLLAGCALLNSMLPKVTIGGGTSFGRAPVLGGVERIVFTSNKDGTDDIYMLDPYDYLSSVELILDTGGSDWNPRISPDGRKIAFSSDYTGNNEIYLYDINSKSLINLTNDPSYDLRPRFSPDGTHIAFDSNRDGKFDIWMVDINTKEVEKITDLPCVTYSPCFHPDGDKIVFTHRPNNPGNSYYNDLYMVDLNDLNNITQLTTEGGSDTGAIFNSDGSKMLFGHTDPNWKEQIYIMDFNENTVEHITTNTSWNNIVGTFSPDESKIVFYAEGYLNDYQIYMMDVDGDINSWVKLTDDSGIKGLPVWGYLVLPPTEVPLDIKPGSCPNPINVKSQGTLPVAVLGTADFDVNLIDPTSITLEGVSPLRWDYEDVSTPFDPYIGKDDCELDCNILGPDGMLDLTFKFDTQAVLNTIGHIESYDIEEEDLEAFESGESDQLVTTTEDVLVDGACLTVTLTGTLTDGTEIVGEDLVLILRKGK